MTPGHVVHAVRSDAFAGVERYIAATATELAARGWAVTVVGGNGARMRAELPGSVEWVAAPTTSGVLRALHRIGAVDVVHAHMTAAELAAVVAGLRHRSRLVVTRHFAAPRGRTRAVQLGGRLVRRRIDVQIAISRFVADSLGEPSVVIPNGVRSGRLDLPRQPTVLVLQRLEPEKDTATAIRAWARSGLADEGWRMVVHGTGSQRESLEVLIGDSGVRGSVRLAGSTSEARRALATASVLVSTALAEPFGLTVVEAMAEATPVVATDSGAHRETLGEDGVWFAPGDVDACADQLRRLCGSEAERRTLGERLRSRHHEHFSLDAHVDLLEAMYQP